MGTVVVRGSLLASVALAAAAAFTPEEVAQAHSFVVSTTPAAGERLTDAPDAVTVQFSEPLTGIPEVRVVGADGDAVDVLFVGLDDDGRRVVANLPVVGDGVYEVFWRVESIDGHVSEGQLAFAVGNDVPADLVVSRLVSESGDVDVGEAAALGVLLGGVLVALGGVLSERLVWPVELARGLVPGAPLRAALVVATAGAIGSVLVRQTRRDGDLWPWRWHDGLASGDRVLLVVLALVAFALAAERLRRARTVMIVVLIGAAALIVWQGHSASAGRAWSVATVAHVTFAGVWLGALVHLAVIVSRRRPDGWSEGCWLAVGRYARLAAVSVGGVVVVGVVLAFVLLDSPSQLWTTTYGRTLSVKLVLVLVGLAMALASRIGGLRRQRFGSLRALTRVEAVIVVGVVVASALLGSTAPAAGGRVVLGVVPLAPGAVWSADLAGSHLVLLGATEDRTLLRVIAPGGQPVGNVDELAVIAFEATGRPVRLHPRSCGPGCAEIDRRWPAGTTIVEVTVPGDDYEGGTVSLGITWPAGDDGSGVLAEAVAATRAAARIEVTETVTSGADAIAGPYAVELSGRAFVSSQPYASGAVDVQLLPDDGACRVLSLVIPGSNMWAKLWISTVSGAIVRSIIVDPGHRVDETLNVVGTRSDQTPSTSGCER